MVTVIGSGEALHAGRLPGPRRLPLIGSLADAWRDPLAFLADAARRYGPVVDLGVPAKLHVGVFDAALAHDVLTSAQSVVQEIPPPRIRLPDMRGQGIVTASGRDQRRYREVVMRAFATRHLAGYQAIVRATARRELERWREGQIVELVGAMAALSRATAAALLFEADLAADAPLARALDGLVGLQRSVASAALSAALPWDLPGGMVSGRTRREAAATVLAAVARLADTSATRAAPADLPASVGRTLARASAGDWSVGELDDNLMQLYLAGNDTVSCALSWTLYLLATHPAECATLRRELHGRLAARDPDAGDLEELPFLNAVAKESLRLYPTSPFGVRYAMRPLRLGGYDVPTGAALVYSPWVNHRLPALWADADAFRPDRFLPAAPQPARGAYLPFAAGPNSCLGAALAQLQLKTVVAMALSRFSLEPLWERAIGVRCTLLGSLRHTRPDAPMPARLVPAR